MDTLTKQADRDVELVRSKLLPLGASVDRLHELRETKRALEAQLAEVEKTYAALEQEVIDRLDVEAATSASTALASVSIKESIVPQVVDWDAYWGYIRRHNLGHMVERRPSVTGCRELFESKGNIPGIVPFKKRRLGLLSKQEKV